MKTIIINEEQANVLKQGMDRHSFISHVKDYLKRLFKDPINAQPDSFLIMHGLNGETLKKHLEDKNLIVKKTYIKNENGKDMFHISYKLNPNAGAKEHGYDENELGTNGERPLRRLYAELFEENIVEGTVLNETDCGGCMQGGGDNPDAGTFIEPLSKPLRRKTIYITKEQYQRIQEEAVMDTAIGDFGYDAPPFKKKKDPTYNHKNMMKKSFNNEQ